jgi:hypothetical protein
MSELVQIIPAPEVEQLRWANLCLQREILCAQAEVLQQKAEALIKQAEQVAAMANGLVDEACAKVTNDTANRYEPRIVEGQLQFHLKSTEESN